MVKRFKSEILNQNLAQPEPKLTRKTPAKQNQSGKMMGAKSSDFLLPHHFARIILPACWKSVARRRGLNPFCVRFKKDEVNRGIRGIREKKDLFLPVFRVFLVFRGFFCPIWFWPSQLRISDFFSPFAPARN